MDRERVKSVAKAGGVVVAAVVASVAVTGLRNIDPEIVAGAMTDPAPTTDTRAPSQSVPEPARGSSERSTSTVTSRVEVPRVITHDNTVTKTREVPGEAVTTTETATVEVPGDEVTVTETATVEVPVPHDFDIAKMEHADFLKVCQWIRAYGESDKHPYPVMIDCPRTAAKFADGGRELDVR